MARAAEWDQPLFVISMDVTAAFDRMSPALAAAELSKQGAHPAHVSTVLDGAVGARCIPRMGPFQGAPVPMDVGVRQGGIVAPLRCGIGFSLPRWNGFRPGGEVRVKGR